MQRLTRTSGLPPVLFGETATSALLPWSWAAERLTGARNYWVATVRPDGRPHCRPLWASGSGRALVHTGSPPSEIWRANPEVSVNLEGGDRGPHPGGRRREGDRARPISSDSSRRTTPSTAGLPPRRRRDRDTTGHVGPAYRVSRASSSAGRPTCATRPAGPSPPVAAHAMRIERADPAIVKGWYLGPWNSTLPITLGYAPKGIDEPHIHTRMTEIYLVARGTSELRVGDRTVTLTIRRHRRGASPASRIPFSTAHRTTSTS